jgi:hypothetical protein
VGSRRSPAPRAVPRQEELPGLRFGGRSTVEVSEPGLPDTTGLLSGRFAPACLFGALSVRRRFYESDSRGRSALSVSTRVRGYPLRPVRLRPCGCMNSCGVCPLESRRKQGNAFPFQMRTRTTRPPWLFRPRPLPRQLPSIAASPSEWRAGCACPSRSQSPFRQKSPPLPLLRLTSLEADRTSTETPRLVPSQRPSPTGRCACPDYRHPPIVRRVNGR